MFNGISCSNIHVNTWASIIRISFSAQACQVRWICSVLFFCKTKGNFFLHLRQQDRNEQGKAYSNSVLTAVMNISPSYKSGGCPHGTFNDTQTAAVSLHKQSQIYIYIREKKSRCKSDFQSTETVPWLKIYLRTEWINRNKSVWYT